MTQCSLCGGNLGPTHTVLEMMHGTREPFTYGECTDCRSLQLLDVPDDLGRYYPSDYYSFAPSRQSRMRRTAKRIRAEALVRGYEGLAARVARGAARPMWASWLEITGLDRSASICDIGCGNGELLLDLKTQGFRHLAGADAFIEGSMKREGVPIEKATPDQITGRYDLVMLNHSFEHMPDPIGTLRTVSKLRTPGGWLMIRVPVAGSPLWDEYGTHWASIDAPRHLVIPSHKGMAAAISAAGLTLVRTLHETSPVQFWRSEQYRQGISLFDERAHEVNPSRSGFTPAQIRTYRARAAALNDQGDSAAAAFFVR